jgi:hypothetical protein
MPLMVVLVAAILIFGLFAILNKLSGGMKEW